MYCVMRFLNDHCVIEFSRFTKLVIVVSFVDVSHSMLVNIILNEFIVEVWSWKEPFRLVRFFKAIIGMIDQYHLEQSFPAMKY